MGCSSSTPAASPASTVTIGGKAGKVTMTRAELLEWEKKRHERELEKQLQRRLYEQKDLLREKALPMMLDSTSCDDLTALVEDGDTVAQLQQLRRKEAKQKAEAEQRWMIFSNLDALEEADMTHIARFMQTVMNSVPGLENAEEHSHSMDLLNSTVEDIRPSKGSTGSTSTSASTTPDDKIILRRENSKEFISAIRSLSNSSISRKLNYGSIIGEGGGNRARLDSKGTIQAPRSNSKSVIQVPRSNSNSLIQMPRSNSSGGLIQVPRMNSKNSIQIPRMNSSDTIQIPRMNSKNSIQIPKTDSSFISAARLNSGMSVGDSAGTSRTNSVENIFSLDRLVVESDVEKSVLDVPPYELLNFDIPAGPVTGSVAINVFHLYKREGSLSRKSVHKLLKQSYKLLKSLPNVTQATVGPEDRITVVGDIHGQLRDLMHIIEESGFPSDSKKYIFNGDFVDRGAFGVECMCVLLAFLLAFPDSVYLNRGNHEDFAISCAYGFQQECCNKYDDVTFGMFVEVFHHLPLFALINDAVFVVHGGLFHCQDASLSELNEINRGDFSLKDIPEQGEDVKPIDRDSKALFLKQLQRDALWSDPMDDEGIKSNPRGAGVAFGADVTKKFLAKNSLKMVVRSHECVRTGFDQPFSDEDANLLCTVFSASNYGGGGNSAAYMIFFSKPPQDLKVSGTDPSPVEGSDLSYSVFYFDLSTQDDPDDDEKTVVGEFLYSSYADGLSLYDLILAQKVILLQEFKAADENQTGSVSKVEWARIMQRVLKLNIAWLAMLPAIVLEECLVAGSTDDLGESEEASDDFEINYTLFLDSFTAAFMMVDEEVADASGVSASAVVEGGGDVPQRRPSMEALSSPGLMVQVESGGDDGADGESEHDPVTVVTGSVIEALYSQHRKLEAVFRFFDKEGTGTISRDNFIAGCELLNCTLPPESQIEDMDRLARIMDVSQSGEIDVNEFFEMFRLSNIHHSRSRSDTLHSRSRSDTVQSKQGRERADSIQPLSDILRKPSFKKSMSGKRGFLNSPFLEKTPDHVTSPSKAQMVKGSQRKLSLSSDSVDIEGIAIAIDHPRIGVEASTEYVPKREFAPMDV